MPETLAPTPPILFAICGSHRRRSAIRGLHYFDSTQWAGLISVKRSDISVTETTTLRLRIPSGPTALGFIFRSYFALKNSCSRPEERKDTQVVNEVIKIIWVSSLIPLTTSNSHRMGTRSPLPLFRELSRRPEAQRSRRLISRSTARRRKSFRFSSGSDTNRCARTSRQGSELVSARNWFSFVP